TLIQINQALKPCAQGKPMAPRRARVFRMCHILPAVLRRVPLPSRKSVVQKSKAESGSERVGGVRIIKKYPNRRLYDTDTSSYITLAEVKALVMDNEPFVVRDAKSNDDLTRSILLQIILEEETAGVPIFTEQVLANIIRFYGHA